MESTDKLKIIKNELESAGLDIPSDSTLSFLIGYIPEKSRWGWT